MHDFGQIFQKKPTLKTWCRLIFKGAPGFLSTITTKTTTKKPGASSFALDST